MPAPRPHDVLSEGWVGAVLLGVLIMLAWTNVSDRKKWALLRDGIFRLRLGQQTMRDDISLRDRGWIALSITAVVLIALFVHQVVNELGGAQWSWPEFLQVLALVAGICVAHLLLLRITGWFFQIDKGLGEYLYTVLVLLTAFGLLLLPVSIATAYLPYARRAAIITGCALLGGMVLYRWLRAVVVGLGHGVGAGGIFLYICASEILPAALAAQAIAHHAHPSSDPA